MKQTLLITTALIITAVMLIVGCETQREIIVAKWSNGTPKKVNYVVGEGVKQEIVGRIIYYRNGEIEIKGEYEKGKKHGEHKYYDKNGQIIKEETYKNGKLDGQFTGWYENGQKNREVTLKDGKEDGLYTGWYENGQKAWERTYKDGEKISAKCWDWNGNEEDCDELE